MLPLIYSMTRAIHLLMLIYYLTWLTDFDLALDLFTTQALFFLKMFDFVSSVF